MKRRTLDLDNIKILVLDEVDRMLDMGFLKDVDRIITQCPTERQTMLFSATISSDLDYLAKQYTRNAKEISVKSYVDSSKLKQVYYDVQPYEKFSLLVHLLEKEKSDLVMIFCSTRRNVDFLVQNLQKININAQAIHGGLAQNKRTKILEEFHAKGTSILVCTDVAARGLDINSVSHIYNYDLPKDSKEYVHRIGRTARAGKEGKAINIVANRDYENFNKISEDKSLKIEHEETPEFKTIRIEMDTGRRDHGRGNDSGQRRSSGRNFSRGNNSGQRRSSGRNFSRGSNSGQRRDSRGNDSEQRNESGRRYNNRPNYNRARR
ncbi:MAG: DEAD/DEAH box helicase-like protein [archaeon GW2011_AR13]|nr:MAG: DEAD/DEAH box helicase-like protein [archaeon GW2011_AR13]